MTLEQISNICEKNNCYVDMEIYKREGKIILKEEII